MNPEGVVISRTVVLEELHVAVRVPRNMDRKALARLRRVLASGPFRRELVRAVRALLGSGSRSGVRVTVSR